MGGRLRNSSLPVWSIRPRHNGSIKKAFAGDFGGQKTSFTVTQEGRILGGRYRDG